MGGGGAEDQMLMSLIGSLMNMGEEGAQGAGEGNPEEQIKSLFDSLGAGAGVDQGERRALLPESSS